MPVGSTRDMPAVSCEEVKASEGEAALCKNWVKPNSSAEAAVMNCYLEAKGLSLSAEHYKPNNYTRVTDHNNRQNHITTKQHPTTMDKARKAINVSVGFISSLQRENNII